jgi:hypothetical protein
LGAEALGGGDCAAGCGVPGMTTARSQPFAARWNATA